MVLMALRSKAGILILGLRLNERNMFPQLLLCPDSFSGRLMRSMMAVNSLFSLISIATFSKLNSLWNRTSSVNQQFPVISG